MLRLHHVAVETDSVQNSIEWYDAFLGCRPNWSLSTFSELTRERLPGIRTLVELTNGDVRFHVFERDTPSRHPLDPDSLQFQHVALEADSPDDLGRLRRRWIEL
jgi:catechol 2,3-dioxygenase-like lactoylglutathione lyase family enzyme